jgi:hypothetical protein
MDRSLQAPTVLPLALATAQALAAITVDRARIRGVEIAYTANDVGRDGLDLSSSVTFAGSLITRNEKFSG